MLLIGPTGSGKTPLGQCLERHGLWGRRCAHFDFGANLRALAGAGVRPEPLTQDDVDFVARALRSGALLENEKFYIAAAILRSFAADRQLAAGDLLLLNGLPRHVDQARDVDRIAGIRWAVHLECSPDVVRERIRLNAGGDRHGRVDDSVDAVEERLQVFRERTAPLLEHCRRRGARVLTLTVTADTTPSALQQRLEQLAP